MENLGIFYDHLYYFTAIGNILWPFCIFCGNLIYIFSLFGPRKIWQPWLIDPHKKKRLKQKHVGKGRTGKKPRIRVTR
jgi:hypothetical protein